MTYLRFSRTVMGDLFCGAIGQTGNFKYLITSVIIGIIIRCLENEKLIGRIYFRDLKNNY